MSLTLKLSACRSSFFSGSFAEPSPAKSGRVLPLPHHAAGTGSHPRPRACLAREALSSAASPEPRWASSRITRRRTAIVYITTAPPRSDSSSRRLREQRELPDEIHRTRRVIDSLRTRTRVSGARADVLARPRPSSPSALHVRYPRRPHQRRGALELLRPSGRRHDALELGARTRTEAPSPGPASTPAAIRKRRAGRDVRAPLVNLSARLPPRVLETRRD